MYHFSVPNHKHKDTQQFILTQCFHIFLLFSIGGAKKTKNGAKLSIGLDINMEVPLQCKCFSYVSNVANFNICFLYRKRESWKCTVDLLFALPHLLGLEGSRAYSGEVCVCRELLRVRAPPRAGLCCALFEFQTELLLTHQQGTRKPSRTLPHRHCIRLCRKQRFYGKRVDQEQFYPHSALPIPCLKTMSQALCNHWGVLKGNCFKILLIKILFAF